MSNDYSAPYFKCHLLFLGSGSRLEVRCRSKMDFYIVKKKSDRKGSLEELDFNEREVFSECIFPAE